MVGGVPDFARSDERYEEAFREAGFDEVGSPPEGLAAKIKASDIRNALLVALDNWSFCARDPRRWRWASDVSQQAGGDTAGWRGRVRDPAIWKDEATLFKVIETAPFPEQSVALLLAIELHTDAPGKPRVAFLKRLHERHPHDFWINLRLGMLLLEVGGPAEAVGYYKTALAIRPGMALSHNTLGSALTRTNRSGEAIGSD
jgi:eukaryotic-like serine/threonine-protein kinase